ncbi:MAG: hypothetical protein ABEI13_02695, partial [Candidatus Paceibacteria bacterium]
FEKGVKVSGSRGYVLKNEAVQLHYALLWYTMSKMHQKGFEVVAPPAIVKGAHLYSSGHFPAEKEEVYEVEAGKDEAQSRYLAGTSEVAILGMYQNTTCYLSGKCSRV